MMNIDCHPLIDWLPWMKRNVVTIAWIAMFTTIANGHSNAQTIFEDPSTATNQYTEAGYTSLSGSAGLNQQMTALQAQVMAQDQELQGLRSRLGSGSSTSNPAQAARWFAGFESVVVQPIQSNSTGLIIETDDGYGHVMFPWELMHSPRIEMGKESYDGSLGWRVRYWQFRHGESFTANAANGLIPVGNEGVVGYLTEDGDITSGLAFIEEGTFTSSVRTDVMDWELQRHLMKPLDLYAGIRYAKLGSSYRASTDQGTANAFSEFRGIGPTAALRFTHVLPLEKLSLFATLRGSLLFGKKQFEVSDSVNGTAQSLNSIDLRSFEDGADSFAGNAEMQLGLRYAPADCLVFRVALEAQHFADVGGANPVGVFTGPDSGLSTDSPLDDDLSFVGVTVGAELGF